MDQSISFYETSGCKSFKVHDNVFLNSKSAQNYCMSILMDNGGQQSTKVMNRIYERRFSIVCHLNEGHSNGSTWA